MADIIVKPYTNFPEVDWDNLGAVLEAWRTNKDFYTPFESTACMSRHNWLKHGNKLDGVTYKFKDLTIELEKGIL